MKNLILSIALLFSVASVSATEVSTDSTNTVATASARAIANALQLNEAQYMKVRSLEKAKIDEQRIAQATLSGVELETKVAFITDKFTTALMQVLTCTQQKAYLMLPHTQPAQQMARVK